VARVAARSLSCPQCGGTISVRNGFKAKTAACPSCDTLLDLSKPPFEILAKLESKQPPKGFLCVGLRGKLDDVAIEIVGRIVLEQREYDPEDGWETSTWDEWLVLQADGTYLWIGEERGGYSLQRIVHPETPPTRDELNGSTITVDGKRLRVRERGQATIEHIEGELTWRAPLHQPVFFLDAGYGDNAFSVEYSDEEIEFFSFERLTSKELFELFELKGHLALLEADDAKRQAARAKRTRGLTSLIIALGGAFFAFMCSCGINVFNPVIAQNKAPIAVTNEHTGVVDAALVAPTLDLGTLPLTATAEGYNLSVDVLMAPPVDGLDVSLRSPSGKLLPLLNFKLTDKGWAKRNEFVQFSTTEPGDWKLLGVPSLRGGAQIAPAGSTVVPPPGPATASWTLVEYRYNGIYLFLASFALLLLGGLVFIITLMRSFAQLGSTLNVDLMTATRALHERIARGEAQ